MKKLIYLTFIFGVFLSCKNEGKQVQDVDNQEDMKVFRLSEFYDKFKYHDLKEFDIKNVKIEELNSLDSLDAEKIFNHIEFDTYKPNTYFFYSTMLDTNQIVILSKDVESTGMMLELLFFDKNGKYLENEILADDTNYEDGYNRSRGYFENFNTYFQNGIQAHFDENDIVEKDSFVLKYTFMYPEKTKIDTLFFK